MNAWVRCQSAFPRFEEFTSYALQAEAEMDDLTHLQQQQQERERQKLVSAMAAGVQWMSVLKINCFGYVHTLQKLWLNYICRDF